NGVMDNRAPPRIGREAIVGQMQDITVVILPGTILVSGERRIGQPERFTAVIGKGFGVRSPRAYPRQFGQCQLTQHQVGNRVTTETMLLQSGINTLTVLVGKIPGVEDAFVFGGDDNLVE